MWNKTLQLHTSRCFEQYDRITLEPRPKPRPEILDIARRDDTVALFVFLQRRRKLANAGHNVGARRQCETSDVRVTLLRRSAELAHRTKDDYPLPSATGSFE